MPLTPDEQQELDQLKQLRATRSPPTREALAEVARQAVPGLGIIPPKTFSRVADTAMDVGKKSALPVAGGVAGFAAGGALAGPVGAKVGESVGSGAGEFANQALGITERSKANIALAAAAPPVTRGLVAGGRALVRAVAPRLPGASALLHEQADDVMRGVAGKLSQGKAHVDALYAEVSRHNPSIRTADLSKAIKEIRGSETAILSNKIQNQKLLEILDDFEQAVTTRGGVLPFKNVHETLKRVGEMVGSTEARGGTAHGQFSRLYRAFNQDLETTALAGAGGPTAVGALKRATSAARREFAAEDFGRILDKSTTLARQGDALSFIRGGAALKALKGSKEFQQAVRLGDISAAEVKEIESLLLKMAKLPALPPPAGVNAGSRNTLASGGVGMAAGQTIAGPPGAIVGGGIGLAAPFLIAKGVMSPAGRKILNAAIAEGRPITSATLGVLANVLRSATMTREPRQPNQVKSQRTLPAAAGPFLNTE